MLDVEDWFRGALSLLIEIREGRAEARIHGPECALSGHHRLVLGGWDRCVWLGLGDEGRLGVWTEGWPDWRRRELWSVLSHGDWGLIGALRQGRADPLRPVGQTTESSGTVMLWHRPGRFFRDDEGVECLLALLWGWGRRLGLVFPYLLWIRDFLVPIKLLGLFHGLRFVLP